MNKWGRSRQKQIMLAIATLLIVCTINTIVVAQPQANSNLPPSKVHPLPTSLAKWSSIAEKSDYFKDIDTTPLGYLVWSQFPIRIYIQQPSNFTDSAADRRYQAWVMAVRKAVAEWNVYLPLQEINNQEKADIIVLRSQPTRKAKLNPNTGLYDLPRAVTAVTNYKFYLQQTPSVIVHKMTIEISPSYTGISLLATARHELGHALGIWGHSKQENDALYFSQVSNPGGISDRDINTLQKIYQQPTKLGWKIYSLSRIGEIHFGKVRL